MTQPPLYPLPWWLISHSAALASVPRSTFRATWQLAVAYWAGGCVDLPTDDTSLAYLAHLPQDAWKLAKPKTMPALDAILPHLKREHERLDATRAGRRIAMANARAARKCEQPKRPIVQRPLISPTRSPVAPTQRAQIAPKVADPTTRTGARFTD